MTTRERCRCRWPTRTRVVSGGRFGIRKKMRHASSSALSRQHTGADSAASAPQEGNASSSSRGAIVAHSGAFAGLGVSTPVAQLTRKALSGFGEAESDPCGGTVTDWSFDRVAGGSSAGSRGIQSTVSDCSNDIEACVSTICSKLSCDAPSEELGGCFRIAKEVSRSSNSS